MTFRYLAAATVALTSLALAPLAFAGPTPAPDGARVYFVSPQDGETVTSPVVVRFGLEGLGVAPAGIEVANTGHHHLLINVDQLPDPDRPIPADDNHRHFGGGQTQVALELPPGEHSLQLMLGDHGHVPHDPVVVSEKITVIVE
jgi:hypothetical protein